MAEVSAVHSDPNFAIVCSFIDRHGSLLNLPDVSIDALQRYLEEARFVPDRLRDVLLVLLRKWKRTVKTEKWERTLIAFCYTYSQVDAWELEKFGFPRCKISTKLRMLKNLLELQFDCNNKFKEKINEQTAEDLRFLPVGRDKNGLTYWLLLDKEFNVVVYREEHDDVESETWQRVVSSRDELEQLIEQLGGGESGKEEQSGSVTPAVTGSGASSDTEGKVTVKEELKTEDIVSPKNDTETKTLKKEPPDRSVKEERGKDEKTAGVPEQTLGADVKTETREAASGKLKEENDEDENVGVKTETDAKVLVKPENGNESTKATLANGSHDKDTVAPPVGGVKQEKGECELASEESKDNTKDGQGAEGDKGKEAASEGEEKGERCSRKEGKGSEVAETSVTEKVKLVSKNAVSDGDHGPCETGGPNCEHDGLPHSKGSCEGDRSKDKDKDSSSSEKHQNVTENGQDKDSSQDKDKDKDKDTPEDKLSVEGQHRTKDVSDTQEDDKERHHSKDSLQEKQDSAKERQKDSVEKKQDSGERNQDSEEKKQDTGDGKQESVTEKQDTVEDTQEDKEASAKEESVNCHDKDKDDPGRSKQKHVDSDVSCVTGDTDTGKIETNTNKSLEEKEDDCKPCEGEDKEAVGKKEGEKGSVSQRRKRPRRSDKLQLDGQAKDVPDSSPLSSDSDALPSNHSSEEPPSKRQRARMRKKTAKGRRGKSASGPKTGKKEGKTGDSTEEDCEKVQSTKPNEVVDADGNHGDQREVVTHKRGRKTKRPAAVAPPVDSTENSCDSPAPLRRSSRANRGQRKINLEFGLDLSKKRRGKRKGGEEGEEEGKSGRQQEEEEEEVPDVVPSPVPATKKTKKKRRGKQEVDEEFVPSGKRKKRKRHRVTRRMSSDEDVDDDDDDDEFLRELDEAEDESLHWSTPASSSKEEEEEDREEYQPTGRNAQRSAALKEKRVEAVDETNCTRCGKASHPELILLCDQCDVGYHTACLRPPLMLIPDGDWFCPTCEQTILLAHLQTQLTALDALLKKNDRLVKRKERLAFVGISLDNILTDQTYECDDDVDDEDKIAERRARREEQRRERRREHRERERRRRKLRLREDEWEDEETEAEETEEEEEEEERGWQAERRLRRCREQISYKFEEYDELIRSAIRDDVVEDTPAAESHSPGFGKDIYNASVNNDVDQTTAPSCGRGKDIENDAESEATSSPRRPPKGMGKDIYNASDTGEGEGDDCRPPPVLAKKKKTRRLTGLSDDDEEEEDSGEEYQATDDSADSDANELEAVTEEDSDDWLTIGNKRRRRRKGQRSLSTRRSSRRRKRTSKYDDDFVDDEEDGSDLDSDEFLPVRRAVVKTNINYREISDSDTCSEYGSDASRSRRTKRRKSAVVSSDDDTDVDAAKKTRHRRSKGDVDDSDYHVSSDSGKSGSYCRQVAPRKPSARRRSESDASSSNEKSPRKQKKRNRIESSEDDVERSDSESGHKSESERSKSETKVEALPGSSTDATEHIPGQVNGGDVPAANVKGQSEVKGQPDGLKVQNGSFMIENLLKETGVDDGSTPAISLVETVSIDNHDDNSDSDLSGVDDLVKFVIQE